MPAVNGMSTFNAQPTNNQQYSNQSINLYDTDTFPDWNPWIDSLSDEELASISGIPLDRLDVEALRSQLKDTTLIGRGSAWLSGYGTTFSEAYQNRKAAWEAGHDLERQYRQFSRLGISPYALMDNTSVSASGSSINKKPKDDDNSGAFARILAVMILALARMAA